MRVGASTEDPSQICVYLVPIQAESHQKTNPLVVLELGEPAVEMEASFVLWYKFMSNYRIGYVTKVRYFQPRCKTNLMTTRNRNQMVEETTVTALAEIPGARAAR